MTCRFVTLMLFVLMLACGVQAFLPPDAKAREPQLRVYYQDLRDNYEKGQVEWRAELALARERTKEEIVTPPWMRGEEAKLKFGAEAVAKAATDRTRERIRHILISIMFLALIVGGAGWVWYKTREIDG